MMYNSIQGIYLFIYLFPRKLQKSNSYIFLEKFMAVHEKEKEKYKTIS